MAHNPELDHEYRETKKPAQPDHGALMYGDISGGLQPRAGFQARMDPEMMQALRKDNPDRMSTLKYTAAALGVMLVIAFGWYILSVTGILPNY